MTKLYDDESMEINITGTFEIQAENDFEGVPNIECNGNIYQSKLLAGDTPSESTFNHKRRRILSL